MSSSSRPWLGALVLFALTRCDCGSPVSADSSTLPDSCQQDAPVTGVQRTDILFVVDNSGSMSEEQNAVVAQLSAFVEALRQGNGLEQDFQFGVITTSVYRHQGGNFFLNDYASQQGHLQPVPSTGERVLSGSDPDLVPKFGELIRQGTSGSGQETAFEAVRLALTPPLADQPVAEGGNRGFLRDSARLLVVVVTDEDDCSETPPWPSDVQIGSNTAVSDCTQQAALLTPEQGYFDFLQTLTDSQGARREVVWAAIAPVARSDKRAEEVIIGGTVQNADCPTSFQAGFRHRAMATLFDPQLENLSSICSPDYRDSLLRIALLATLGQSVEVMSTHDPQMLQVSIERANGTTELCTLANGGIRYEAKSEERAARIFFQNQCLRRAADQSVAIRLLCAG